MTRQRKVKLGVLLFMAILSAFLAIAPWYLFR